MKSLKIAQKTNQSLLSRMGVTYVMLRRGLMVVAMTIFLEFVLK